MQGSRSDGNGKTRPRVALYFRSDSFDTATPQLMGRQAAGEGFLRALLEAYPDEEVRTFVDQPQDAKHFAQLLQRAVPAVKIKRVRAYTPKHLADLRDVGTLFVPGPALDHFAELRLRTSPTDFSCCGITHTTASHRVMDLLGRLLTGPVMPWDALICTSRVVKDTVERVLDDSARYLKQTLGATRFTRPQLPIIPLGVETKLFKASDDGPRERWRQRLGIAPGDVAFLFVGRLSFHAKAHPAAMYRALERAVGRLGSSLRGQVHLIQAGWFSNPNIERAFKQGAAELAPSVHCHFVDGRDPEARFEIWQAADVFTSLADNIQETFGLTPIEAMAAGLPVVVSDWDGYRDTVRDGVDGFRVRTFMPAAGEGTDLAFDYQAGAVSYDLYCGLTSQLVAVDVDACAQAYAKLIQNPELRREMGRAGRARAESAYEWQHIIRAYGELWFELGQRRRAATEDTAGRWPINPLRTDPFHLFAAYPSRRLGDHSRLRPSTGQASDLLSATLAGVMQGFASRVLPDREVLESSWAQLCERREASVGELLASVPAESRALARRSFYWMLKHGLIEVVD